MTEMARYKLTKNNLHVEDSYCFEKRIIRQFIFGLRWNTEHDFDVWKRSDFSLMTEWYCHNFLYRLGIFRSRTKDVDLNHPQKIWEKVVYPIFGSIAYIFIK